jgi:hypothetical protein
MPILHLLYYDDHADYLSGHRDVEVQRLAVSRWCEDRLVCRLELVQRVLGLNGPGEALVLLQESVKG